MKPRGFAVLGPEAASEAGRKGGKARKKPSKRGHLFDSARAREASKKGVEARRLNKKTREGWFEAALAQKSPEARRALLDGSWSTGDDEEPGVGE